MAHRLHILMSCSRAHEVPALSRHYLRDMEPHPFELRWHILQQGPEPDPKGQHKVNEALDDLRGGWVFTPSDDTIQSRHLFKRLGEVIKPGVGAVVFRLKGTGAEVPATPANARVDRIGLAQTIFAREFIGDERPDYRRHKSLCDTKFVTSLFRRAPEAFVFVDEPLCTFNSLEWATPAPKREPGTFRVGLDLDGTVYSHARFFADLIPRMHEAGWRFFSISSHSRQEWEEEDRGRLLSRGINPDLIDPALMHHERHGELTIKGIAADACDLVFDDDRRLQDYTRAVVFSPLREE